MDNRHRIVAAVLAAVILAILSVAVPQTLTDTASPQSPPRSPPAAISEDSHSQVILRFEIAPGLHLVGNYRLELEPIAQSEPLERARCQDAPKLIE